MSVLLEALKKAAEEKQRKQFGEETSLPENKETPSVQPETALVENNAASIKSTDSQAIEEGPAFKIATEKEVSSSAHSKEKALDLETNLALHDSSFSKKMVLDENTEGKEAGWSPVEPGKQSETDSSSSNSSSFAHQAAEKDWSLNQIPGYQNPENDVQKSSMSAQDILQAMQFKQEQTLDYSKLVLSSLVVMTLLLGLGYYGVIYFQKQSDKMTTELQQYQATEAPLKDKTLEFVDHTFSETADKNTHLAAVQTDGHQPVKEKQKQVEKQSNGTVGGEPSIEKTVQSPSAVPIEKTEVKSEQPSSLKMIHEPGKQLKIVSSIQVSDEVLGYAAYQKNDFQQAKLHYLAALKKNPKSLAALFGLGATSAKQGEVHAALNFYRRALDISPYNKEAETAVAILEATLTESEPASKRLKFMINQSPSNAKLHAALGHQYAKQKNWLKAQKQYFKAYQLNSDNADYALNLAISLDRIGQYSLAKHYYQQALVFSQQNKTEASTKRIKNRLLTLQQYLEQGGDQ
ncbi:MAG: hypothetical protein DSZ27_09155 [Thiomicrospira sp.]|nr:MAG: hypothetical protein DSZ27_09155 [Thiomicrospira sp.]